MRLRVLSPAGALESFTCTVNEAPPLTVGVPEMIPALDNVRPAGSAPFDKLHA
jgi:hypothetical protein